MIKINLDSTPKGKIKYTMKGSIEVSGDTGILAYEMYSIIKNFEKNAPDALEIAMAKLVNEMIDKLEEE